MSARYSSQTACVHSLLTKRKYACGVARILASSAGGTSLAASTAVRKREELEERDGGAEAARPAAPARQRATARAHAVPPSRGARWRRRARAWLPARQAVTEEPPLSRRSLYLTASAARSDPGSAAPSLRDSRPGRVVPGALGVPRVGRSGPAAQRIFVASASVPAAHLTPALSEYVARSTTMGAGLAPRLSTMTPKRA